MSQFNLQFTEVDKSEKKVNRTKEDKVDFNVGIVTRCARNRDGMCHVIISAPEPLNCPCNYFIAYDKIAIDNFEKACKSYGAKRKIHRRSSGFIEYHDLLQLDKLRGK
jgi:hypothetical protein